MQNKISDFLKGASLGTLWQSFELWLLESGRWYLASMLTHMVLFIVLGLALGTFEHLVMRQQVAFDEFDPDKDLQKYEVGETPLDPTRLDTASLTEFQASPLAQEEQHNDDSAVFEEKGGGMASDPEVPAYDSIGMGMFDANSLGPAVEGPSGIGIGIGEGMSVGSGGAGAGWGARGSGHREKIMAGATPASERAVAAALNWFALHQNPDGSWSLDHFMDRCHYGRCDGPGVRDCDAAATAMALLPFLAAGQTHRSRGPYQKNIAKALQWLVNEQNKETGDLAGKSHHQMYSHGLAAITLCEAYGMTQDSQLRDAAQLAINFIVKAQGNDGGWRYQPQAEVGDTSVLGWQVMAMKSGQMAGLEIPTAGFDGAKKFLKAVSAGRYNGLYGYQPGTRESLALTAVGGLCQQYMGMRRGDPSMIETSAGLMANMPVLTDRNVYFWYYGTQVMHNQPGKDWDAWNRKMRSLLIETQEKDGCAAGSWNPDKPDQDTWGRQGGRIMVTSLSCLTLEIYYRYLPIYKLDREAEKVLQAAQADVPAAKADAATE